MIPVVNRWAAQCTEQCFNVAYDNANVCVRQQSVFLFLETTHALHNRLDVPSAPRPYASVVLCIMTGMSVMLWVAVVANAPCMGYHMEHNRVLRHVWYRNGTVWTNDSDIQAHMHENPNFFSFPIRYATADSFTTSVPAGPLLVFGKDYNWRVWYHLLFDASIPILHALHTQYNLLGPHDRNPFTVAFANREEESLVPIFAEFWGLFTDNMYTDSVVWDRARERGWGVDATLYYNELLFISKELPYPTLTPGRHDV